jgi:NAD(P)-dependent dehydrogenase (short-subunit alcohol dehydrogenase family)
VKAKGKIDVLVADAGIGEFAPLATLTEEHFDKLFDLNAKGTLRSHLRFWRLADVHRYL